jgi:ribose 5-phosphate isomerase B
VKVAFAADHRGFELKQTLLAAAAALGHEVVDVGTREPRSCDYADYARQAAEMVARGDAARAVLVCATGVGMCIAANKVPGIRAALCWSVYMARLSRLHNDANVLCFSGDQTAACYAGEMLAAWLAADFEGGRHERRLALIRAIEKDYGK